MYCNIALISTAMSEIILLELSLQCKDVMQGQLIEVNLIK